jgi:signal transduction histidine kinase
VTVNDVLDLQRAAQGQLRLQMGTVIEVHSEPGQGTRVVIERPVA